VTDGMPKLGLAAVLANAATRSQFVNSLVQLSMLKDSQNRDHFDGVDLDFEVFAFKDGRATWAATTPNWIAFINELSLALHAKNQLLSITTPVLFSPTSSRAKQSYDVYSWAQVAPSIDRLRIMTYDYSTDNPGPIGPITWAEESVKYAVAVMPASKVFIGVAGYGHGWVTKVTGTCPADSAKTVTVGARTTFRMVDVQKTINSYKAVPVYKQEF
jgi:spore germination protein YaaH